MWGEWNAIVKLCIRRRELNVGGRTLNMGKKEVGYRGKNRIDMME